MDAAAPTATGWLRGPASDLFFGTGLGYVPFFVAFAFAGSTAVRRPIRAAALLTATPRYGATLLRVYESPSERRRYAVFGVGVTALVRALFVAGVYDVTIGSWILAAYFTWSPWHDTGQNDGIALMFPGRSAGDLGAARAAVSRSLEITPSAIGYVNLGILDAGGGRLGSAQVAYERALVLEPGMPEALYRLALLEWRRGKRAEALRPLEDAAARAPERADIRGALESARAGGSSAPAGAGRRAPGVAPAPARPRAGQPAP